MIFFLKWFAIVVVGYLMLWAYLTHGRGSFRFVYWKPMALLLEVLGMDGITFGARCYSRTKTLIAEFPNGFEPLHLPYLSWQRRWWRHEFTHFFDWVMRPFFGPVYCFWLAVKKYAGHPDERRATHESDKPE